MRGTGLIVFLLAVFPAAVSAQISTTTYAIPESFIQNLIVRASYTQVLMPYVDDAESVILRLEQALKNPSSFLPPVTATGTSTAETIVSLLAQVALLQAQIDTILASQATSTPSIPSTSASSAVIACPVITRTLLFGSEGTDVSNLQLFLASEGLLETASATGFFGTLTEAALQNWQTLKGIVTEGAPDTTGYGAVGPKTRAALAACR